MRWASYQFLDPGSRFEIHGGEDGRKIDRTGQAGNIYQNTDHDRQGQADRGANAAHPGNRKVNESS